MRTYSGGLWPESSLSAQIWQTLIYACFQALFSVERQLRVVDNFEAGFKLRYKSKLRFLAV